MAGPPAELLAVGRVRRPHGIHGEAVVEVTTDFPERLVAGMKVAVGVASPESWLEVDRVRWHKGAWLVAFAGMSSREEVEELREKWLFLPALERAQLPTNYYYEHELVGATCELADGTSLGRVTGLLPGGTGMLLEVATTAGEVLVPFSSPIVVRVDSARAAIVLDPPRGLFDGDAL